MRLLFSTRFVFRLPPQHTEGLGQFFGPASSAQVGLRFSFLETSTYLYGFGGVLEPHMCVKTKLESQTGPMMLALGGCWDLEMPYKPQQIA